MADRRETDNRPTAGADPAMPPTPGGHPLEAWISTTLRVGVLIAAAILLLGLLSFIVAGPRVGGPVTLSQLLHGQLTPIHPADIVRGITAGQPPAVIQLGVIALILTPVARVAMTVALFIAERDRTFVVITAVVFTLLVIGLLGVGV